MEPSTIQLEKRGRCPGRSVVQRWLDHWRAVYVWLSPADLREPDCGVHYTNSATTLALVMEPTGTADDPFMAFICADIAVHFGAATFDWTWYHGRWMVRIGWA